VLIGLWLAYPTDPQGPHHCPSPYLPTFIATPAKGRVGYDAKPPYISIADICSQGCLRKATGDKGKVIRSPLEALPGDRSGEQGPFPAYGTISYAGQKPPAKHSEASIAIQGERRKIQCVLLKKQKGMSRE